MSILDRHERLSGDPDLMDELNNQMGCYIGDMPRTKTCEQLCFENINDLMTARSATGEFLSSPVPIGDIVE